MTTNTQFGSTATNTRFGSTTTNPQSGSIATDTAFGSTPTNSEFGSTSWRVRAAALSLCAGILAIGCATEQPFRIATVEPLIAKSCAESTSQTFDAPSRERDEAFIECIVRRDPSSTTEDLRHRLATGEGEDLYERLMSGQRMPVGSDSECPYLRVAVQSPVGSDDATQKPMRDLFSQALTRAGFQVVDERTTHEWWASSLALDTGENSTAWTILVRAVPEIGNGGIQFTSVEKVVSGRSGSFSGMQSLRSFTDDQAPEAARLAAEGVARELLPAAQRRCDDVDAELEATRKHLEELRRQLADEMEQVRREKARRKAESRHKQLDIEVEG
jgi:hypothetical protein